VERSAVQGAGVSRIRFKGRALPRKVSRQEKNFCKLLADVARGRSFPKHDKCSGEQIKRPTQKKPCWNEKNRWRPTPGGGAKA